MAHLFQHATDDTLIDHVIFGNKDAQRLWPVDRC